MFGQLGELPRTVTYEIGLISRYADVDHPRIREFAQDETVKTIDVYSDVREIAAACLQCDVIVSSSLHGLILADALNIPSRWLGVSELVMRDGFKFQDYFMSVRRNEKKPLHVEDLTVARVVKDAHLKIVPFDRQLLLNSCPFRHSSVASPADNVFEGF